MGYIYCIRNNANGKLYIGQTENIEERWRGHRKNSSNCRYLKHAFNKYGVENFEFKVLIICFDTDMNAYEVEYMRKYNTLVPNGYNLREGGNSGKHHEDTKKKIADSLRGKPHPRKDILPSEETKQKISNTLKGRTPSSVSILREYAKLRAKPIVQLTMDGKVIARYASSVPVAEVVGSTKSVIHRVCKRENKTFKGFKWMYESEYLLQNENH